ncbi:hypothetical protein F5884DRAFT_862293 [Xylogone sp. PMI_703]|nr:hypothetical protein F5884DRAFT_862293 [Xylogone sp. PMI_703]
MSSARSEAFSDDGVLGESAYEFVDTDSESRDGATESIASTDFGRPDDIASLADTEQSEEESEAEEEEHAHVSTIVPTLDNSLITPTVRNSAIFAEELEKPMAQSIEFEEPLSLGAETISVKHTVADYNEEETQEIVQRINLRQPPERLLATIRQTMTKQGLSTAEPLRIIYIGSHSAKQDIIRKIASSVTVSVDSKKGVNRRQSRSQLYNVVPVTAFGSASTPEIELMHSSEYQILVDDCVYAKAESFEEAPEKPDIIKLTLEDNFSYHSVPDGDQGFIVEPQWELPHIAVFYCDENDDIEVRRTRTLARKFMGRHGVPSIVISHKQLFDKASCMTLDQHSIHMCLESRDPRGRGNIIHQRLPIDLFSFLNIDARQMNRNLAYLTGLHDIDESSDNKCSTTSADASEKIVANVPDIEKPRFSFSDSIDSIRHRAARAEWRVGLWPLTLLLLSVSLTATFNYLTAQRSPPVPAISINSKTPTIVIMSTEVVATVATPNTPTSSSTPSIATAVSTKTITVVESTHTGTRSLSVIPSKDLKPSTRNPRASEKPENKTTPPCSAEVIGDAEILIRMHSDTKLSWLTKEALSVNITRGNTTIDIDRVYSSDDGIVLLLPKKEAYGVMNITVITTRKPRVNQTFQVDFGTNMYQELHNILETIRAIIKTGAGNLEAALAELNRVTERFMNDQQQHSAEYAEETIKKAQLQAASVWGWIKSETAKRGSKVSENVESHFEEAQARLNNMKGPVANGILKAQIQSKLFWLKLQGKMAEYEGYKIRAANFVSKVTGNQEEPTKKTQKTAKHAKREHREAKKAARKEHREAKKATKKSHVKQARQRVRT